MLLYTFHINSELDITSCNSEQEKCKMSHSSASWKGKEVPSFNFYEITPTNEKIRRSITDFRGKPVVIHFYSSG